MPIGLQYRTIAEVVGMSYVDQGDGRDTEIDRLADCVGMTLRDIQRRPSAVAAEITAYLDELVRNP